MYVFILGERNPNGKDPHITATENAQTSASFRTHGNSTLFIAADHRNPCAIFPVMKNIKKINKSLQVASQWCAKAQQDDFQNGFPAVTKPEGSLPS